MLIILLLSSCKTTNIDGIETEILAKCVSKDSNEAKFRSENPNYHEIIIKDHLSKYKVGRNYVLILRKN